MVESRGERTVAGPGELTSKVGLLLVNLEPHITRPVESIDRLSVGYLGHVEMHGPGVVDIGVGGIAHGRAGCDTGSSGRGLKARLETGHLRGSDVSDKAVVLPVVGAADVFPVASGLNGRESVWV